MNGFIHIGYGNIVNLEKVVAIVHPEAAPIKRLVARAKETENLIDATQGRKTKSVIVMENHEIILSALVPETLASRMKQGIDDTEEKEE